MMYDDKHKAGMGAGDWRLVFKVEATADECERG